jgi:hypothetical protein
MTGQEPGFPGYSDQPIDARERAEQLIEHMDQQLQAAVEVVAPGTELTVAETFSLPAERRDDDPGLELSEDQEASLRAIAANLGWGRTGDKSPEDQNLRPGYVAIIEGGQPHKVIAELTLALEGNPSVLFVAGSPNRMITAEAERESGSRILGIPKEMLASTEYGVNRQLVEAFDGFEDYPEGDTELGLGYDIDNNNQLTGISTGQFLRLGKINGAPVILMRIDRENYMDGDQVKYRKQPDSAAVMQIVDAALKAGDDTAELQIGFVTSSTYEPSRAVDQIRAWAKTGREVELVTYGTERLAEVKGVPSQPGPINQLPGELRKADDSLQKLRQEIA